MDVKLGNFKVVFDALKLIVLWICASPCMFCFVNWRRVIKPQIHIIIQVKMKL